MEQEMIRRLLAREEAGMADLLLHYGPLMRYIIAPILPNPQDREDCLSEVTLRIWEKIDQFDPRRGSWNAWLTAITRNTALNHARKALGSSAEELPEDTPAAGHTPRRRCCKGSGRRPCGMPWSAFPTGIGSCFTENTITCSPRRRSPPSWA